MLWGQYPALVDGPNNSYVDGMAYVVETEQQQKMLEHYETDVYSVEGIRITIEGKRCLEELLCRLMTLQS